MARLHNGAGRQSYQTYHYRDRRVPTSPTRRCCVQGYFGHGVKKHRSRACGNLRPLSLSHGRRRIQSRVRRHEDTESWPVPNTPEEWYQPASDTDDCQQSVHGYEDARNVPDEHLYTIPGQGSRITSPEPDGIAALRQLLRNLSLSEDLTVSGWTEAFSTEAVECETINTNRDGENVINLVRSPRSVYGLKLAPIVTQFLQLQRAYNLCTWGTPEQTLREAAGGTSPTQGMTAWACRRNGSLASPTKFIQLVEFLARICRQLLRSADKLVFCPEEITDH